MTEDELRIRVLAVKGKMLRLRSSWVAHYEGVRVFIESARFVSPDNAEVTILWRNTATEGTAWSRLTVDENAYTVEGFNDDRGTAA